MDPNQCLKDIRKIINDTDRNGHADWQELVDKIEALDEWLSKGGFYPEAWAVNCKDSLSKKLTVVCSPFNGYLYVSDEEWVSPTEGFKARQNEFRLLTHAESVELRNEYGDLIPNSPGENCFIENYSL